jgi:GntR family histidine utilization transcriptional repressor
MRRISNRTWAPGDLIPGEVELAQEFGCARATVNRALRQLADAGLLDRRRKGGTRVARYPVRKATLDIPVTRLEIENRGVAYRHQLMKREIILAPDHICAVMDVPKKQKLLHLPALHLAGEEPFLFEDRWVNLAAIPDVENESFSDINANEWLIEHAPFSRGDIQFSAANVTGDEAEILQCDVGQAIFVIDRTTWNKDPSVTSVRLAYAPGFHMRSQI